MRSGFAVVGLVVLAAACGGTSQPEGQAGQVTTAPPTSAVTTTEAPVTTTSTPVVEEIEIIGDDEFVDQVERALALLEDRSPEWHLEVLESIDRIEFVEAGSGMDVFTQTFRVGRQTAWAPGYPVEDQVEWLAGAIVHDACHSEEYSEGRVYTGRDAELECLIEQAASLELHEDGTTFFDYVNSLIEGIDDPANAYWADPNRHW